MSGILFFNFASCEPLKPHKCQKLKKKKKKKKDSLHVPAIKNYWMEVVGLSVSNYTFKIRIFMSFYN